MYHRDFIKKFVSNLKKLIESAILEKTWIESKNIAQNFDEIIMHLTNLLKRVYSIEKVVDEITSLRLKFIIILIKIEDKYWRKEGMKSFSDLLNQMNALSSL